MKDRIVVKVAAAVYCSSYPHGIYHIEQLFKLEDMLYSIHDLVTFEARMNGKPLSPPVLQHAREC